MGREVATLIRNFSLTQVGHMGKGTEGSMMMMMAVAVTTKMMMKTDE